MRDLLAAHQVKLEIQELEYDAWHRGEVVSDIWLNSVNFTLPIEFSLFAYLYEVPLIQQLHSHRLAGRRLPLASRRV